MRTKPFPHRKLSRLLIFSVVFLVVTAIPVQAANPNPGILPPNAHPFGLSYGEWSARWWQWALSIPKSESPFFDDTGENCGVGQLGKVWFLGGTFVLTETASGEIVGSAERTCTIPVGTALFFPIINTEASEVEGYGHTDADLRAWAEFFMKPVTSLSASIDGVPVEGLTPPDSPYRVQSPLFEFLLPENNILDRDAGSSIAVSDGYWLMLSPLSAGTHEIVFHAFADFTDLDPPFTFELDITYHLNVVPKSQFRR